MLIGGFRHIDLEKLQRQAGEKRLPLRCDLNSAYLGACTIWPLVNIIHITTNVTGDMIGTTAYVARVNELHLDVGEATNENVSVA